MSRRFETRKRALITAVGLGLVLLLIYSGLQIVESTVFKSTRGPAQTVSKKTVKVL